MPDPNDYDAEDDFVSACIPQRQKEHPEEDVNQSTAICYSMWDDKAMGKVDLVRKIHADGQQGMEFILSDATSDRYGDSIVADGWDLKNFLKNPIALFNHDSHFPIGRWEKLLVKDGALRGHLQIAPKGASARIDEIRALIDAGILRAVSVGFRPIESEPIENSMVGGMRYLKSELVESSLVSVPANPNALAVAKSLKISDSTLGMVFAKHGSSNILTRSAWDEKSSEVGHRVRWGGKEFVRNYRT